jgi:hypothetical protein
MGWGLENDGEISVKRKYYQQEDLFVYDWPPQAHPRPSVNPRPAIKKFRLCGGIRDYV